MVVEVVVILWSHQTSSQELNTVVRLGCVWRARERESYNKRIGIITLVLIKESTHRASRSGLSGLSAKQCLRKKLASPHDTQIRYRVWATCVWHPLHTNLQSGSLCSGSLRRKRLGGWWESRLIRDCEMCVLLQSPHWRQRYWAPLFPARKRVSHRHWRVSVQICEIFFMMTATYHRSIVCLFCFSLSCGLTSFFGSCHLDSTYYFSGREGKKKKMFFFFLEE